MSNSTQFHRYLNDARIRKILNRKPSEEGFSLIELVVVIAVLAILAAVALPNFLGVQKDGQIAAAKNTLATVVKECVTQGLRQSTTPTSANIQADNGKLNGYSVQVAAANCYTAHTILTVTPVHLPSLMTVNGSRQNSVAALILQVVLPLSTDNAAINNAAGSW